MPRRFKASKSKKRKHYRDLSDDDIEDPLLLPSCASPDLPHSINTSIPDSDLMEMRDELLFTDDIEISDHKSIDVELASLPSTDVKISDTSDNPMTHSDRIIHDDILLKSSENKSINHDSTSSNSPSQYKVTSDLSSVENRIFNRFFKSSFNIIIHPDLSESESESESENESDNEQAICQSTMSNFSPRANIRPPKKKPCHHKFFRFKTRTSVTERYTQESIADGRYKK